MSGCDTLALVRRALRCHAAAEGVSPYRVYRSGKRTDHTARCSSLESGAEIERSPKGQVWQLGFAGSISQVPRTARG
ncbi:hypothetical protein THI_2975 [Thiomonas arsenitoxydans]|uniref:Uncharacterized protein n=1 Tax=Thiomonas arsenitoxydans (strain DSM 22701 / CIP 110005 / 3As) TaxID=426114 RepID=D6CM02_THIA3|nr:hypothetical protein THI_2975 [Thiomonas arsenitoxydans]